MASASSLPQYDSSNWYLDSATFDHMTHDLSQLSLHQPYQGTDHITVGNGNSIPILHTGKDILPTPHHTFKLNKFLPTPIASNLVSVHKLTNDNYCTITFEDYSFIV
mgnify:CR=1 FL=1